jgi:lysosomal acid lipase/cholesteryl ester hydrolase
MANSLAFVLTLTLFCGLAVGSSRTKLFSDKSQNGMAAALAPSVGDGVCASMIEPQDYICEEHTVICLYYTLFIL